jgi:hypothetical protein
MVANATASAAYDPPLTDVLVVTDFPTTIYGGSTDTAQYQLTFSEKTSIIIQIDVCHPLLEKCEEWQVGICLDDCQLSMEEISPGSFRSGSYQIEKGAHMVDVVLTSVPNIYPDQYGFDIEFAYTTPTQQDEPGRVGTYASAMRTSSYTPPLMVITPTELIGINTTSAATPIQTLSGENVPDNPMNIQLWMIIAIISVLITLAFVVWNSYLRS